MADTTFETKLKASSTSHDVTGEFFFLLRRKFQYIYILKHRYYRTKIIKYKKKRYSKILLEVLLSFSVIVTDF